MNPPDPDQKPLNASSRTNEWEREPLPDQRAPVKTNPVLGFLRIVIWLLPSIIIPVLILSMTAACNALNMGSLNGLLIFLSSLGATIAIGYLDQRISAHQQQIEFARVKDDSISRVGIFIICQIFIVPVIWVTLIYGFCLMAAY
ncbi:MAG: hypothetical protein RL346_728 [Verrucomicrobiota bacterium]|jgi:hypothetical protein